MSWRDVRFTEAVNALLKEFDMNPEAKTLALVWRSPNEWNVLDYWLMKRITHCMDEERLRVVLWLTREEAVELTRIIAGGK